MPQNKAREYYLQRKYGISLRKYNALLKKQGGGCNICGKTPEQEGRNLAVDHNHKTREIRGICCSYCNHRLIGRHTDPELLRRIAYHLETKTGWFVPEKRKKRKKRRHD